MCDNDDKTQKWICDYCTYENYPSSLKCTMCKGQKPLTNEDIFRLSPPQMAFDNEEERGAACFSSTQSSSDGQESMHQLTSSQAHIASSSCTSTSTTVEEKWPCQICTYLNWPRSQRCVQCYTKRGVTNYDESISTGTAENLNESIAANAKERKESSKLLDELKQHSETKLGVNNKKTIEKFLETNSSLLKNRFTLMHINTEPTNPTTAAVTPNLATTVVTNADNAEIRTEDEDQEVDDQCQNQLQSSVVGAASNRLSAFDHNTISGMGITTKFTPTTTKTTTELNNSANPSHNEQQQQQEHQESNDMQQQRSSVNKWMCSTCTYENWPKSLKCSMCGAAKDVVMSSAIPLGENEIENTPSSSATGNYANNALVFRQDDNKDAVSSNNCFNITHHTHTYQLGSPETINNCDTVQERQERRQRQIRRKHDLQWLNACLGIVENNYGAVEAYLSCGGDPTRALTSAEIAVLNRDSMFDPGLTLIHLAIRFHREEMLPMLLSQIQSPNPGIKRVPSYIAPDLAAGIRRHFSNTLRMRKSVFCCFYVQEHATFALPADIEELPLPIQDQLYEELLDRDAQKQLESPPPALNWSQEITAQLGSRLMVLWNRSAGDCLLDSAMQATWGVFDKDNMLRSALADSMIKCAPIFYQRWREYEMLQATMLQFTLEESQWQRDWRTVITLASQPGSSLEQIHIFTLAHILRRPIIVYGVKVMKSFRGEDIGYARFEGLYLPLFWEQSFCIKSPIALGYTRGHFSALVPMERYGCRTEAENITYLPLMDCESKLLPIHFLSESEMGREESLMRQWLDVCVTDGGLLVAQQKLRKRPLLVAQMLEEWLNHYRQIAQRITAPYGRRPQQIGYSSDGDSDEE